MLISRLKTLCIEIYKAIIRINPNCMQNIFAKASYRISSRHPNNLKMPKVNQTNFDVKSLRMLGLKIWNELPEKIKSTESLENFKTIIRNGRVLTVTAVYVGFSSHNQKDFILYCFLLFTVLFMLNSPVM